jgi:hypothetical protein
MITKNNKLNTKTKTNTSLGSNKTRALSLHFEDGLRCFCQSPTAVCTGD